MNELRGVGTRGWLGLREFTQNRYPKLWAPFERYFPDGLTNSRGERVTDLFEECCSRDIHGDPHHADWLEVPAREHECRYMNLENPVWRAYLKAIVRIHIDAGVDGIQFDEPDSPLTALRYGGDFSHDTMAGFRGFLRGSRPMTFRASSEDSSSTSTTAGGSWHSDGTASIPSTRTSWRITTSTSCADRVAANFAELSSYVREYAASVGRTVLVSSNLYDGAPWHDPLAGMVDILVPEQRHTLYEQPGWMRYIAGFGGEKPVCISTNPYGGVMPELLPKLNRGRADGSLPGHDVRGRGHGRQHVRALRRLDGRPDRGCRLGPPRGDHRRSRTSSPTTSTSSRARRTTRSPWWPTRRACCWPRRSTARSRHASTLPPDAAVRALIGGVSLFRVLESLSLAGHPLDVLVFHDGRLRADRVDVQELRRYRRLVLPEVHPPHAFAGAGLDGLPRRRRVTDGLRRAGCPRRPDARHGPARPSGDSPRGQPGGGAAQPGTAAHAGRRRARGREFAAHARRRGAPCDRLRLRRSSRPQSSRGDPERRPAPAVRATRRPRCCGPPPLRWSWRWSRTRDTTRVSLPDVSGDAIVAFDA